MNEQTQTQTPFAQVEVGFLQAISVYIEQMPLKEVRHISNVLDNIVGETEQQFVQVDLGFLQALVDYLQAKPYREVFQFVNILTGQVKPQPQVPQPQVPQMLEPDVNISEHIPEGFDASQSTQDGE